jgi:hypothetical protein
MPVLRDTDDAPPPVDDNGNAIDPELISLNRAAQTRNVAAINQLETQTVKLGLVGNMTIR